MKQTIDSMIDDFRSKKNEYTDNLLATTLIDEFVLNLQILLHEMEYVELNKEQQKNAYSGGCSGVGLVLISRIKC